MDAKGWGLLVVGMVVGALLVAVSGPVRDVVLDAVDAVTRRWWSLVDAVNRAVAWAGMLVLVGLAMWAVVELVLPRLAEK